MSSGYGTQAVFDSQFFAGLDVLLANGSEKIRNYWAAQKNIPQIPAGILFSPHVANMV